MGPWQQWPLSCDVLRSGWSEDDSASDSQHLSGTADGNDLNGETLVIVGNGTVSSIRVVQAHGAGA